MADDAGDTAAGDLDGRESQPGSHDIRNLLLAARLRVHALRVEQDPAARQRHLDAIDECIAGVVEILKSHE